MKTLLCFLLSLALFSCRNDFTVRPESSGIRLAEVYFGKDKMYEYEYNREGLLAAEKSKWRYSSYSYDHTAGVVSEDIYEDPGIYSSSSVIAEKSWNRTEWVSPKNTDKVATIRYRFDQDKRMLSSTQRVPGAWIEYIYGESSRITEVKMYFSGKLDGIREYTYDSNGNMIRDEHYHILADGTKRLSNVTEYEFDNAKNPYFNISPANVPGEKTNPNNITRKKYSITGYPGSDTGYTYTYNSAGYPVSRDQGDFVTYYKYGN